MREAEPLRPEDPRLLGGFRLTGRLGAGARGVVYLGRAPSGEPVAIRALRDPSAGDAPVRVRVRDVAVAQRVDSRWTARILAADPAAEVPYVVSEYVAGPSLQQVVERHGPRTGAALRRLATGTIRGLAAVHQAGLVHGDLHPGTVRLEADGPRVVDFALGDPTGREDGAGRAAFQAPEQLSGEEATAASDVFAWAVTMVFASCGRAAFGPDDDPATAARVQRQQPELGMLAGRLQEVALRCLAKDPRDRPTAAAIAAWLEGVDRPVQAAEPEPRAHDTSGIEVRIRDRPPARRAVPASRKRAARRNSLIAGVLAGSAAVGAALFVWTSGVAGSALGGPSGRTADGTDGGVAGALRTGPPVEIATAGGYRYRLAAVGAGADPGAASAMQSSPPPGTSYVHADYVLGNPLDKPVLLDLYTVDVFIRRDLLPERTRGLCMWHNGVPEDMCTPPARPQLTSRLSGDPPTGGTGGDRYLAPGASYVVRVSVDVPLDEDLRPGDLRLYVWKPAYMADALVQEVPFPG